MVEIEEHQAGQYALWTDGNEPSAHTVRTLTTAWRLEELGIASELWHKHQLVGYAARREMGKDVLWRHLLGAEIEQQLLNAGSSAEHVEAFWLKPPGTCSAEGLLAQWP
jgi:hypothetical protein